MNTLPSGSLARSPGEPLNVLWLQSGGCGGCSMSLLCADTPDLPGTLRDAGIRPAVATRRSASRRARTSSR